MKVTQGKNQVAWQGCGHRGTRVWPFGKDTWLGGGWDTECQVSDNCLSIRTGGFQEGYGTLPGCLSPGSCNLTILIYSVCVKSPGLGLIIKGPQGVFTIVANLYLLLTKMLIPSGVLWVEMLIDRGSVQCSGYISLRVDLAQ